MIGAAGSLLAAIAIAAVPQDGCPKPSLAPGAAGPLPAVAIVTASAAHYGCPKPSSAPGAVKSPTSPPKLKLLRPARPTPAQRVMPGLH